MEEEKANKVTFKIEYGSDISFKDLEDLLLTNKSVFSVKVSNIKETPKIEEKIETQKNEKQKKVKKSKPSKKEKDPNAPKRPLAAYFFFAADVREQIKFENPGAGPTVVAKLIGDKWTTTNADGRAKYIIMAAEAKEKYEKEMEEYKSKK